MAEELDALPVTVLLATEPGQPVTVLDGNAALRMAVADRESIGALGEEWDRPGVYVLLDPVAFDGAYDAYVGKAPAGLRDPLRNHLRQEEHWSRAVLVIRDTTYGWDSAQVGWLEGRLHDLLDGATLATLVEQDAAAGRDGPPLRPGGAGGGDGADRRGAASAWLLTGHVRRRSPTVRRLCVRVVCAGGPGEAAAVHGVDG